MPREGKLSIEGRLLEKEKKIFGYLQEGKG